MKIRFITGPLKGQEFPVKEGLVLSRSGKKKGEQALADPQSLQSSCGNCEKKIPVLSPGSGLQKRHLC